MKLCIACDKTFQQNSWTCPACGFTPETIEGALAFAPEFAKENSGFDIETFSYLYDLEAKNFWYRARNRLIVGLFRRYFPKAKRYLEIGCGTGYVLQAVVNNFPNTEVSGSEIYSEGLKFAKSRVPKTDLFEADARRLPYENEFDLIGSFDVLEHIEEDVTVLKRMHRALREGGGILITVPQHPFLWSDFDDYAHHVRRYQYSELKQKLEQAGFDIVRIGSFVSILFPIMIATRLTQRKQAAIAGNKIQLSPDELRERSLADFAINPVLNWIFEQVLLFEHWLIYLGIRFPFGGSLFAVAIKRNA